ncbi:hypothetical protein UK23_07815 [Lentzea aerocolonigenes]|uniref:Uncharacterized protein n=1 Tax=Lentzea aerocolonigenes TaxID=68170 RepID=A0A0F0HBW9_LENAE|nr:hypothetical protein UK23_07815 [Lentzea aerocolonigenes]
MDGGGPVFERGFQQLLVGRAQGRFQGADQDLAVGRAAGGLELRGDEGTNAMRVGLAFAAQGSDPLGAREVEDLGERDLVDQRSGAGRPGPARAGAGEPAATGAEDLDDCRAQAWAGGAEGQQGGEHAVFCHHVVGLGQGAPLREEDLVVDAHDRFEDGAGRGARQESDLRRGRSQRLGLDLLGQGGAERGHTQRSAGRQQVCRGAAAASGSDQELLDGLGPLRLHAATSEGR